MCTLIFPVAATALVVNARRNWLIDASPEWDTSKWLASMPQGLCGADQSIRELHKYSEVADPS